MAIDAVLNYDIRSNSKSERNRLVNDGYILANINGKGMDSIPIKIKKDEFRKTYKKHGRNCVLRLEAIENDQNSYDVMVKDIQVDAKNYDLHHVDFQRVVFTESFKADVSLKYKGLEYLQPKRLILNRLTDVIPVSGLPQDIPHEIEFDVSDLQAGDNIYAGDLKLTDNIKLEVDEKTLIASIIGG